MIDYITAFFRTTSFHGLPEITKRGRWFGERILWITCVVLCVLYTVVIITESWEKFQENPTVMTIERNRNEWSFNVPAVILCAHPTVTTFQLKRAMRHQFAMTSRKTTNFSFYMDFVLAAVSLNISNFKELERFKDRGLLQNMSLGEIQNKAMDAPQVAVMNINHSQVYVKYPLKTIYGMCFATNSALNDEERKKEEDEELSKMLTYDMSGSDMSITVTLPPPGLKIFLNSPFEYPQRIKNYLIFEERTGYLFNIELIDTVNTKSVKGLAPYQRKCFFSDEVHLDLSPFYTPVACRIQCKLKKFFEKCGCLPHMFYNNGKFLECDMNGINCLAKELEKFDHKKERKCKCYSSCDEDNYILDLGYKERQKERYGVHYAFSNFPTIRYKRDVVFGKLEMIVSFGGIATLFLGCSILSIVELVFFFTLQPVSLVAKRCLRRQHLRGRVLKVHVSEKGNSFNKASSSCPIFLQRTNLSNTPYRSQSSRIYEVISSIVKSVSDALREYTKYTNLHGVFYIGNQSLHWSLRIFWICVWVTVFVSALFIAHSMWKINYYNSVAYELETDYSAINVSVPAFSICFNSDKEWTEDWCEQHLTNCSINGRSSNCCSLFRKIPSEHPNCLSVNSRLSREKDEPLYFDGFRNDFLITVSITKAAIPYKMIGHGIYDSPLSSGSSHLQGTMVWPVPYLHLSYLVTDEVANEDVRAIAVDARRCRFPDETEGMWAFDGYSYTACLAQCRAERKMQLCNCTDVVVGYKGRERQILCNETGRECIKKNKALLDPINSASNESAGLRCDCVLGCTEQSLNLQILSFGKTKEITTHCKGYFRLSLSRVRRRLRVVRAMLDIAVSIGGVFGLFLGASLMSLAEVIFFFIVRPIFIFYKYRHK